jgi:hypothetical protein
MNFGHTIDFADIIVANSGWSLTCDIVGGAALMDP